MPKTHPKTSPLKLVGVLALQGGFAEHMEAVRKCGGTPMAVRTLNDTKDIVAMILPGGESTTIMPLLKKTGLDEWLIKKASAGMPIFGTCAGLIALSKGHLNLMNIELERNAYGGQLSSFEAGMKIPILGKTPFHGIFIRAPKIKKLESGITIQGLHMGAPTLVEKGNLLAATFHPELTGDIRLHHYFLEKC